MSPSRLGGGVLLASAQQPPQSFGAGELVGDPLVVGRPLGDPAFEQREEHVRLTAELRVHDTAGKAGFVGDRLQGGAGVAASHKHPTRRGQHRLAIAFNLLCSAQTRHTKIR